MSVQRVDGYQVIRFCNSFWTPILGQPNICSGMLETFFYSDASSQKGTYRDPNWYDVGNGTQTVRLTGAQSS